LCGNFVAQSGIQKKFISKDQGKTMLANGDFH